MSQEVVSTETQVHTEDKLQATKEGLAKMLKGGIIMDVVNAEQAKIAEKAGACAVMALERVPADIRREGGIARMSDPKLIKEIMEAVSIPVMAKVRIGHFAEAQVLEFLGVDYIDESEVLTPADNLYHIEKRKFKVPFVCGARNLGEALRRIQEGAAMIRTKGEAGTGDVSEAVRHQREITSQIQELRKTCGVDKNEPNRDLLTMHAQQMKVSPDILLQTLQLGRLPVVTFAAGGLATPTDVSMLMQLGSDGVFVGSGIFKSGNPEKRAKAMVIATTHFNNPGMIADASEDLGEAMSGIPAQQTTDRWAGREGKGHELPNGQLVKD